MQFLSLHHAKGIAELGVQRRATKMILLLRNKNYDERLENRTCFLLKKTALMKKTDRMFSGFHERGCDGVVYDL